MEDGNIHGSSNGHVRDLSSGSVATGDVSLYGIESESGHVSKQQQNNFNYLYACYRDS